MYRGLMNVSRRQDQGILSGDVIKKALVKRKAIAVLPTECNSCGKRFYDKWYGENPHKVICPHCRHLNAVADSGKMDQLVEWGKEKDAEMGGALGSHVSKTELIKKMIDLEREKRARRYGRKVA